MIFWGAPRQRRAGTLVGRVDGVVEARRRRRAGTSGRGRRLGGMLGPESAAGSEVVRSRLSARRSAERADNCGTCWSAPTRSQRSKSLSSKQSATTRAAQRHSPGRARPTPYPGVSATLECSPGAPPRVLAARVENLLVTRAARVGRGSAAARPAGAGPGAPGSPPGHRRDAPRQPQPSAARP